VNAVLLQRLPYQNPESLVQVWNTYLPAWPQLGLSPGDFQDWRQQTQDFFNMAAYVDISQGFNLTGEGLCRDFFRVCSSECNPRTRQLFWE
jgi:hypothetical protein